MNKKLFIQVQILLYSIKWRYSSLRQVRRSDLAKNMQIQAKGLYEME